MKTHGSSEPAAPVGREALYRGRAAQLHDAPGATIADHRASAATLQRFQDLANNSPRTLKLKQQAELMSAGPASKRLRHFRQMADNSPRAAQLKAKADAIARKPNPVASLVASVQHERRPNNTNLPDQLKSGIESLSGISMDHVKVHYNSNKPAQLHAHAYAQGNDIHLARGQERHLPHEAWHIVQQMQGRVRPTLQRKTGPLINDDVALEREADMMGHRALGATISPRNNGTGVELAPAESLVDRRDPRSLPDVVQRHGSDDDDDGTEGDGAPSKAASALPVGATSSSKPAAREVEVGRFRVLDEGSDEDTSPSFAAGPQHDPSHRGVEASHAQKIGRFTVSEESADEGNREDVPESPQLFQSGASSSSAAPGISNQRIPSQNEDTDDEFEAEAEAAITDADCAAALAQIPQGLILEDFRSYLKNNQGQKPEAPNIRRADEANASNGSLSSSDVAERLPETKPEDKSSPSGPIGNPAVEYKNCDLKKLRAGRPRGLNTARKGAGAEQNCLMVAAAAILGKTTTEVMKDLGYHQDDEQHSARFVPNLLRPLLKVVNGRPTKVTEFENYLRKKNINFFMENELVLPVAQQYVVDKAQEAGRSFDSEQKGSSKNPFSIGDGIAEMKKFKFGSQYIVYLERKEQDSLKENVEENVEENMEPGVKGRVEKSLHFVYAENDEGDIRFIDYQPFDGKAGEGDAPELVDWPTPPPNFSGRPAANEPGFDLMYFVVFVPKTVHSEDAASKEVKKGEM